MKLTVVAALPALLVGALSGVVSVGCATTADAHGYGLTADAPALLAEGGGSLGDGLPDPVRLPTPDTAVEAQFYMKGAIAALRAGEPEHSAMFLEAILRSDHLTDRGRANVYWLLAEARRIGARDPELVDALGGFLIAASVVPEDLDIQGRTEEAQAHLLAARGRLALVTH